MFQFSGITSRVHLSFEDEALRLQVQQYSAFQLPMGGICILARLSNDIALSILLDTCSSTQLNPFDRERGIKMFYDGDQVVVSEKLPGVIDIGKYPFEKFVAQAILITKLVDQEAGNTHLHSSHKFSLLTSDELSAAMGSI
ncbi:MAG: hypothetical protein H7A36_06155 [Chlamydiales bacterium]|nr:hypothetical protein [Chlamydiales bacterium]